MKKPNSHIFQLLKAMTPAEKRHFKIHHGTPPNQLSELFDLINKMDDYDEDALKAQLNPTTARNLKVHKIQLHDLLLKSLTAFHSKRSVASKIRLWLEEADILSDKQLFDQAFDRLSKARALCTHYEEYTYLLEISAREFHLKHVSNDSVGISKHPYFEEAFTFIHQLQKGVSYHRSATNILEYLAAYYHRQPSAAEKEQTLKILQDELVVEESTLSFKARFSRTSLLMSLYKTLREPEPEGIQRKRNVMAFDEYPQFKDTMPFHYVAALRNWMNYCLAYHKFDEAKTAIQQGIDFIQHNPATIAQLIYFYFGAIEVAFECQQWTKGLSTWEKIILKHLDQQELGRERIALLCYLYMGVMYQFLNKPAKVQFFLRRAKDCREEALTYFKEVVILLDLISHFEAGDQFLVDKQLKSLEKQHRQTPYPETPLFAQFLQLFKLQPGLVRQQQASALLEAIPGAEASEFKAIISKLKLNLWLNALANKRSLAEEINRNFPHS
jgi:uncharacterized protein YdcH (DUF465 family)